MKSSERSSLEVGSPTGVSNYAASSKHKGCAVDLGCLLFRVFCFVFVVFLNSGVASLVTVVPYKPSDPLILLT